MTDRLSALPPEILLLDLLLVLPTCDLLNLACTNKLFAALCEDESLWHKKLLVDFNFTGAETARTSGWKFIYKGLDKPRVYVWGHNHGGRLGLPGMGGNSVRVPIPMKLPGTRVVSLVAGGWSFHALDSDGNISVWGILDGSGIQRSDGFFSRPGASTHIPMKLSLPVTFRSISCGRMHSSALDVNNKIWNFLSWGRPFRMTWRVFDDPQFSPVQVECGWMFSCVLVKSGAVYAWWPFSGLLRWELASHDWEMDQNPDGFAQGVEGVIQCAPWDSKLIPERLPPLPPLPALSREGEGTEATKLVKIAGLDDQIIGLTNKGHVLMFTGGPSGLEEAHGRWTYLPKFSEARALREHSIFVDPGSNLKAPESLRITHISANYFTFVAYSTGSTSTVLMGDVNTTRKSEPRIVPALQDRNVISVVLGDYHNAALTADGRLYTWGRSMKGSLGLGTRRWKAVYTPTEVRFDHWIGGRKDRFCIAAAACGWHTGALVIDLEPSSESEEEGISEPDSESEGEGNSESSSWSDEE